MGSIGFKDNIRIPEEIFDRITSVDSFEEALDFDEASKELFLLVKETTPLTEGIIRLEKMQVVAFSSLIHSILDVVEFRTD